MKITRRFTKAGEDVYASAQWERRTSRISNPDGSVVFEMNDAEVPAQWSQLATDIMVSKYFRKAGVPQLNESGQPLRDSAGQPVTGPEKSARQVIHRLAGCWRWWGESHKYFDTAEDAQAFYDELAYMLVHQMCAPNSPQWFNTGLNWAYGISGPAQGHFYCDPQTGELRKSADAYTHPQPHACQPYHAPVSTPGGRIAIGKIVKENLIGLEVYDGTTPTGLTRVVAVKANGRKPVLRVMLYGGTSIEATGDHLVYVRTSSGLSGRWVRIDSLEKGMKLVRISWPRPTHKRSTKRNETHAVQSAEPVPQHILHDEALAALEERSPAPSPEAQELAVVRIVPVGTQDVYDIQTESGQYLSNDVIVHNCFIQSVNDDLVNEGGIMDLWTREARLFKYGSGTGTNFSNVRGENEPLSGGGKSSGLMSFLKIGDRAAGAIKSGGTTRRAAKMVCLDLDHPDIEDFINWKVREELKVAAMVEGLKSLPSEQQETAKRLKLKLSYDFNGEAYATVSGQNSNNSIRIPNSFFHALETDGDWTLTYRSRPDKTAKTVKARDLWEQISYAAWRCADPGVQYDDTINQWHTCPASGRIKASNPCVTGDTRVLTPGGIWRRIDQMIHLPARVVTNLAGQQIHQTDGAFPTGTRDVFELCTSGGYRLKLTADHKVWTRHRGWVEAKDLQPNDEVRLTSQPACYQEIGEPQDARFFQMLGLLLSDANGGIGELQLDRCLPDAEVQEEFGRYVADQWGDRRYADDYVNAAMIEGGRTQTADVPRTATRAVNNRRLLSRLRAFVNASSRQARLGEEAFTAGLAAQRHLLRAFFSADGALRDGSLEIFNANPELLEDIQLLLLGFGVQSARFQIQDNECGQDGAWAIGGLPGRREPTELSSAGTGPSGGGNAVGRSEYPSSAVSRHGLRIDPGSLRTFGKFIGLFPGPKLEALAHAIGQLPAPRAETGNWDRVASFIPLGREQVFDLTEPVTSSFVANGLTVHNCSEYMFLDDTACNLASLNVLTFFDAETQRFDIEAFKHAIRVWTIVLEISVLMASFPSEKIARLSYRFRTLGLGYANLGAMLMQSGIPYDSESGRAICGALTAVLTGESYATSAEMARELGTFPGYEENRPDMLRVMRNHRRAAYDTSHNVDARRGLGDYERLDIVPVGIDARMFKETDPLTSRSLLAAARECWDRALRLGEKHGYRNAQTTVIAPTGTIGLLMDCDTTGVEPDFALVKFKKLAGGGYFKIANQSLEPALRSLRYSDEQVHDILQFVMGTLSLQNAPHVNDKSLRDAGFTEEELQKIEAALPGTFELSFAFSPWTLGTGVMQRLQIPEETWQSPTFNLLRHLGFSRREIDAANDIICGTGCMEGAPHLREEHLPVFDTANKCGKNGTRYIAVEGHIRMMAAAQPFISGAISKTINLPNEANVDDIKQAYRLSWELGLKANALYRDGSKLSQPLNVKSDQDVDDKTDEEDADAVADAREEVAAEVALAAASVAEPAHSAPIRGDNLAAPAPHTLEKIVERIVERPLRRRLPDTRQAVTHKFDVGGHEGYITTGLYEDGQPGEVFIRISKEGSTIGGLMDTIATLVSLALQYGVPVDSLVRKFEHVRFEPSGPTRNRDIPFAKSLVDYIFRYLAMEFVHGYRAANAPKRSGGSSSSGSEGKGAPAGGSPAASPAPHAPTGKKGNGHGPRHDPDTAQPMNYAQTPSELMTPSHGSHMPAPAAAVDTIPPELNLRLAIVADPVSQQGSEMQADAPACDVCGSITVRSGTCYKCLNCGNSMGCS